MTKLIVQNIVLGHVDFYVTLPAPDYLHKVYKILNGVILLFSSNRTYRIDTFMRERKVKLMKF